MHSWDKLKFISSLFLGLLTIFGIQTAKAYNAGETVSFSFTRVGCGTGNTGQSTDWYGAPAYLERKIIPPCVNGEVPMISTVKITSPSGCKVNGCGTNPSLECVTLKRFWLYTYTNNAKEPVYSRSIREFCKKCHAEVVKVVTVGNDANGGWREVEDTLVTKNKCTKYKTDGCPNPCPDTCPAQKCEEYDENGDGDVEDETDYKCVLATVAQTTAAPIADGGQTAVAVAGEGAVLGATLTDWHSKYLCECEKEVNAGKKTWCPSNKKGGCCPTEKPVCCSNVSNPEYDASSRASICCDAGFECGYSKFKQTFYCQAGNDCPADYPKKCAGDPSNPDPQITDVPTCCKNEQLCEFYMTKIGNMRIHYCGSGGDKCDDSTDPGFCAKGVCCKSYETCTNSIGIYWCNATSEKECTDAGGTYCEGHVTPIVNLCCAGETPNCYVNPNGVPSCY